MLAQQSSEIHEDRRITIADILLMSLISPSFSITRDSLGNLRFRILFAQRHLRRRLLVTFSLGPRFLLFQSTILNIETDHARHPAPQPSLHLAGTDGFAHVFRRWHWLRSNEKSPFLLASVNRPAHHLVPGQSRPGRSGRCYAGTREHPRLSSSLESFFF